MRQRAFRRRQADSVAMQHDRRNRNLWLCSQALFDRFEARITVSVAETVTVRMDHNVDEVRIVERRCGAVIGRVIELPIRRPQSPQQSTKLAPVSLQSRAAALGVKVILIPK